MLRDRTLSFLAVLILAGCSSSNDSSSSSDGGNSPTTQGPPEVAECTTPITYPTPVTITGTAKYRSRQFFGNQASGGLGSASLTDPTHPALESPIRYAEVRVTNSLNLLVQCAQTDGSGNFSFTLPQTNATFTISVNSRSFPAPALSASTHVYASVLDQPNSNIFYSLTTTVNGSVSSNVGTLTAMANGTLLGGAFNIFDQITLANDYLVSKVGTCASTFSLCRSYDPGLHKVSAYWKKGFNPNDYFGSGGGGLSFYLPGYSRLFILGGVNGDTDNSDTDHFDNSVIIHEYGHFLEDNWLQTDSPGGSHNGNELLDPRLAWSEGWGDFIQAAVRNENHYVDTIGNVDGTTSMAFYSDTELTSLGSDYPNSTGEGNFREFATTRLLWDAVDAVNMGEANPFGGTDDISDRFIEIWAALSKSQYGFRDGTFAFRNPGLFLLAQQYLQLHPVGGDAAATNWTNIRTLNREVADVSHYAQYLISSRTGGSGPWGSGTGSSANGACTAAAVVDAGNASLSSNSYFFSLTPASVAGDSGSLASSNLFQNNRFYHLHIDSAHAGAHSLQLIYQDDDGVANVADLDLYLYNSRARFAVSADMVGYSRNTPAGTSPHLALQNETVNVSLAAGEYLIDVNVYTGGGVGTKADYNLVLDGVVLCPGSLVPP